MVFWVVARQFLGGG